MTKVQVKRLKMSLLMPQNTLPRAESPHEGPPSPLLRAWEAAKFDLVFAKLGTLILAPTGLCTASTPAMRSEVAMSTSGSATLLCASHVHPEMQTKGAPELYEANSKRALPADKPDHKVSAYADVFGWEF